MKDSFYFLVLSSSVQGFESYPLQDPSLFGGSQHKFDPTSWTFCAAICVASANPKK